MSRLTLFLILSFTTFHAFAEDVIVFCDTCNTNSEFTSAANDISPLNGHKTVFVFNVQESMVKAYTVEFIDSGQGGSEKMILSTSVPQRATNAMSYYKFLLKKHDLEDSTTRISNKSAVETNPIP